MASAERHASPYGRSVDALVRALGLIPGVHAIIIGGSRSRGHSDAYSDVDVGVLNDSGHVDEGYRHVVEGLTRRHPERIIANPYELAFLDDDGQWVEVHCARLSEWQEALRICETDPAAVEPWHLEMLQTCHFIVPLFDPRGEAGILKERAQTQPPCFWQAHGERALRECRSQAGRFVRCEKLPPVALTLSMPRPLYATFRVLGAINHSFYFGGWQMEDYLGRFPLKPEGVQETLACVYGPVRSPGDLADARSAYEQTIDDIGRLLRKPDDPSLPGLPPETERSSPPGSDGAGPDDDLFTVPPWLRTEDDAAKILTRLAACIHTPPAELVKYARRRAFCFFQDLLRQRMGSLVEALLALNGIQATPLVELDATIRDLQVQPRDAYHRILGVLHCTRMEDAVASSGQLLQDTKTLSGASGKSAIVCM